MSTLLVLIQDYCAQKGLEVPTTLFAATTAELRQFARILNMVGRDIHRRRDWEICKRRATWNSIAAEDQGALTSAAILNTTDFDHIIPDTLWNNTLRQPLYGPVSDQDWQYSKALVNTGPFYRYKVYNNHLYVLGPPPAGHQYTCFYKVKSWLEISSGSGTYSDVMTADTNVAFWDDDLMMLGIDAFWRREKGLNFTPQMADYEMKIADIAGIDNVAPKISMHQGSSPVVKPGIIVPAGNFTG